MSNIDRDSFWIAPEGTDHFNVGVNGNATISHIPGTVGFPKGQRIGSHCLTEEGQIPQIPSSHLGPTGEAIVNSLTAHYLYISPKAIRGCLADGADLDNVMGDLRSLLAEHIGPEAEPPGERRGIVRQPKAGVGR